MLIKYKL